MSEWISVDEMMPDMKGKWGLFILCDNSNNVFIGYYDGKGKFLDEIYGMSFQSRTTHWMPLPAPPKEEE